MESTRCVSAKRIPDLADEVESFKGEYRAYLGSAGQYVAATMTTPVWDEEDAVYYSLVSCFVSSI